MATGLISAVAAAQSPGLPVPLTDVPGDAVRGRALMVNRSVSLCLLCHSAPLAGERFQGNLAPDLAGSGARYSAAQLRQRLVAPRSLNPDTIMPSYFERDERQLNRLGAAWVGKPVLQAQQIEDLLAWLVTLQ